MVDGRTIGVVAAVAAAVLVGGATPAQATETRDVTADVVSVSPVALVGNKVLVASTYRCTGNFSHLWVSAKQGPGDLTQEGSGAIATSWYQRSYDNVVRCDGRRHTRIFSVDRTKGHLHKGRAYVQVCLLTADDPSQLAEDGNPAFDSNMRYRRVVRL